MDLVQNADSRSMGLGWGSGFLSFHELPGDANAAGPRPHFEQQGPRAPGRRELGRTTGLASSLLASILASSRDPRLITERPRASGSSFVK